MYCILIDAHLSDGAQLAMHDVFLLRGIDPFKVSTRVCVSTHSPIMYVLHSYRCPPLDGDQLAMLDVFPLRRIDLLRLVHVYVLAHTL